MKGRTASAFTATAFLCGPVWAASVSWIDGIGAVVPSGWSISPANPSTANVITFKGPTDKSYGNSCNAEQTFGGTPYLVIDNASRTIDLKFQGPRPPCAP